MLLSQLTLNTRSVFMTIQENRSLSVIKSEFLTSLVQVIFKITFSLFRLRKTLELIREEKSLSPPSETKTFGHSCTKRTTICSSSGHVTKHTDESKTRDGSENRLFLGPGWGTGAPLNPQSETLLRQPSHSHLITLGCLSIGGGRGICLDFRSKNNEG